MNVQRYKVGYYTDEWGVSSNTPCLLKDPDGYAIKFDDYAALAKQRDELLAALEEAVAGMGGSYAIWSVKAKEALASVKEKK